MVDNWATIPVYCLFIEPYSGNTYQYGYHLGTDLRVAKIIAQERYFANSEIVRSVSLVLSGKTIDTFNGNWNNGSK